MSRTARLVCSFVALALARPASTSAVEKEAAAATRPSGPQRNEELLRELQQVHGLREESMRRIREVFAGSAVIGQGNPAVTEHPETPEACVAKLREAGISYEQPESDRICGARYMAPLYDPSREKPQDARACIDRFEFPNIPCAYPVVWVRAREAALLCEAEGKRLCDAHEWEGACAGSLEEPDYRFDLAKGRASVAAVGAMRAAHNRAHAASKSWSYGPAYQTRVCATSSQKTSGCGGGEWALCGSNTFPAGSFPACHSTLGVFDLNGNAAEHMNLPLDESHMSSRGSRELGVTEMKGSWFIFDRYRAHEDWCRWRAPFWHGSRVMDAKSHENYHLGFRCCKTIQ
jgi:formylglycine-generating enzyme required for sulfatase activity